MAKPKSAPTPVEERMPPAAPKQKKLRLQISVDEETGRALRARCGYLGIDVGDVVTIAVKEWLRNQPPLRLGTEGHAGA